MIFIILAHFANLEICAKIEMSIIQWQGIMVQQYITMIKRLWIHCTADHNVDWTALESDYLDQRFVLFHHSITCIVSKHE